MDKARLNLREVVLYGVLGALTFAAQVVMAPLPNIEPVSLMVLVFSAVFGWRALYPVYVFVVMEVLYYGLGLWTVNYLYIWGVLAVAAILLRKMPHPLGWAMVSAVFGLCFGALCGIVDIFIGGLGYAAAKWASGIPFDIAHCAGNFVIALVLFKPLRSLVEKLWAGMKK